MLARRGTTAALAMLIGVSLDGCGRDGGGEGARAAGGGSAPSATASVPSLPECPNTTGKWDECNVRQRLERAGLAPQRAEGEVRQPFLTVPGISYHVGRAELQVFLYPDARALGRDLARIDTVRVQGPDSAVPWSATPTLITSNNLAAILLSEQATQIERVRLALTAGLPAPDSAKK